MESIRNIAIIAHVDHGKTTLVDKIIHECQIMDPRKVTGELILDNNDLEILCMLIKNASDEICIMHHIVKKQIIISFN